MFLLLLRSSRIFVWFCAVRSSERGFSNNQSLLWQGACPPPPYLEHHPLIFLQILHGGDRPTKSSPWWIVPLCKYWEGAIKKKTALVVNNQDQQLSFFLGYFSKFICFSIHCVCNSSLVGICTKISCNWIRYVFVTFIYRRIRALADGDSISPLVLCCHRWYSGQSTATVLSVPNEYIMLVLSVKKRLWPFIKT